MKPVLRLVAFLLCGSAAPAQLGQARWDPQTSLSLRAAPGSAYDPIRQRILMFGGYAGDNPGGQDIVLDDTWEWDGNQWHARHPSQRPSARSSTAMAFDPVRGTVLLFGGANFVNNLGMADTWEWDGRTWRQLQPATSPSGRYAHAMVTDPVRRRIVLFGGATGVFPGVVPAADTWEWDGATWTQIMTATVPEARYYQGMAYEPASGRVVMFGGLNGWIFVPPDTWTYDGSDWTRHQTQAHPSPRDAVALVAHPAAAGRVLLYGGTDATYAALADHWEWNGATWTLISQTSPAGGRIGPCAALDQSRRQLVLFGATTGGSRATWTYDGQAWRQAADWPFLTLPPVFMVFDEQNSAPLVVGFGYQNGYPILKTFLLRNDRAIELHPATPYPPALTGVVGVFHEALQRVVVTSPRSGSNLPNETWLWDGSNWSQATNLGSPGYLLSPGITYDTQRRCAVTFGGNGSPPVAETWELDVQGWRRMTPGLSPSARYGHAIGYDPVRRRTVVWGGYNGSRVLADTWEWDGAIWTQRTPANAPPARRDGPSLVYMPALGGLVLYGGTPDGNFGGFTDTWLWDGTNWTQLQTTPLPGGQEFYRLNVRGIYDPRAKTLVALFSTDHPTPAWRFHIDTLDCNNRYPRLGEQSTFTVGLPGEGNAYCLFGFSSGVDPGIPLYRDPVRGLEILPLNPDRLLGISLGMGLGTSLDASGAGSLTLSIPTDLSLLWFRMHVAGVSLRPSTASLGTATNPVEIQVTR